MSDFKQLDSGFDPNDPHLITTEEKKPNWMDKFGVSFLLFVVALALFMMSFALIFWNEGKTVIETVRLNEGSRLVVPLTMDAPDSDNNGQLVHLTGVTKTRDILSDEMFYVSVNAIKLLRQVEMYQWREAGGRKDGGGELTYDKVWSPYAIDSTKFTQLQGHNNPAMEISGNEYIAANVNVGGFGLADTFIAQLNSYEDYPLTQEDFARINPEMTNFKFFGGGFYRGANPEAPEVGDVRVKYRVVKPGVQVSIIGMQNLDRLETFNTDYSAIKILAEGTLDADTMLRREVNARNVSVIWWLRFGGWVAMLASVWMALSSFKVLHHMFTPLAALVGYNNFEIAFFMSLAFTLLTVAFAWFQYQPAFGVGLMVLSCSLIMSTAFLRKVGYKKAKRVKPPKQPKVKKEKKLKNAPVIEEETQEVEAVAEEPVAAVEVAAEEEPKKTVPAKLRFLKAPKD